MGCRGHGPSPVVLALAARGTSAATNRVWRTRWPRFPQHPCESVYAVMRLKPLSMRTDDRVASAALVGTNRQFHPTRTNSQAAEGLRALSPLAPSPTIAVHPMYPAL
jgi:hypothetical protein